MPDQPWLSIVTVVKDAPAELARTLDSLAAQDLADVEYLVIDSSTEPAQVPEQLAAAGVRASCSWTEPAGIYPAMNEGLQRARGELIYFLNAGDELRPEVLGQVHALAKSTAARWLIGKVEVLDQSGSAVITPAWDFAAEQRALFARGKFAPHQGTFAHVSDLRAIGGFDTSYQIAADYAAFLALTQLSEPLMLDLVIARFHEGGLSTQRWQESFREFHRARTSILRPQGLDALKERLYGARQLIAVGLYRGLWSKVARRG